MQRWEYATVPLLVHATKQILDNWGEDGWELVQVVPGPGGGDQLVAYLKRPTARAPPAGAGLGGGRRGGGPGRAGARRRRPARRVPEAAQGVSATRVIGAGVTA